MHRTTSHSTRRPFHLSAASNELAMPIKRRNENTVQTIYSTFELSEMNWMNSFPSHKEFIYSLLGTVPFWEINRFSAIEGIPKFYGTRMSITAFTAAHHLSLSWLWSVRFLPHPTTLSSTFILSSHLRLCFPRWLFPKGFNSKNVYTTLISIIVATCLSQLIFPISSAEQHWWTRADR